MKDTLTILVGKKPAFVVTDANNCHRLLARRPSRKFGKVYECTCGANAAEHLTWCTSAKILHGVYDCAHLAKIANLS
jgi:hypothetical protein